MELELDQNNDLDDDLMQKIKHILRKNCSPRHVPDEIYKIPDIPYTISGKKMETPVKRILMGIEIEKAITKDAMKNPEIVDFFIEFKKRVIF